MTLKEIAQKAGVSISTVSRVINNQNSKAASKEVQDRIWQIVRETGYTPNISAKSLQKGEQTPINTRSLACLFARTPDSPNDPFFSSLARSVETAAYQQNYLVKSSFTAFDLTETSSNIRMFLDPSINGVAVLGRIDKAGLKFLKQHCRFVAYTGLNEINAKYDQILCDGYQAAVTAVEHLISLGHRHIGYIGETDNETRYQGYQDALESHHLPCSPSYVASVPQTSSGGLKGALKLLEQQPLLTAFFCSNDVTAIGAMRAIRDKGLRIPKDISVISIDDIDTAQYLSPMLTTIHVPIEEMGQMTAKILIDRITGGHTLPMKIFLPFYLCQRESCAPPRVPGTRD